MNGGGIPCGLKSPLPPPNGGIGIGPLPPPANGGKGIPIGGIIPCPPCMPIGGGMPFIPPPPKAAAAAGSQPCSAPLPAAPSKLRGPPPRALERDLERDR